VLAENKNKVYDKDPESGREDFFNSFTMINEIRMFFDNVLNIIGKRDEDIFKFFFLSR
jgi:hypothetical protein